jgi:hypothetical protein
MWTSHEAPVHEFYIPEAGTIQYPLCQMGSYTFQAENDFLLNFGKLTEPFPQLWA